ncbi:hypothetical protein [Schleiferilactobacillus shenzhenensis]|uniref:Uncharacterized protein n=1 Tax=Schleiferilactobacillus shenzhenensis LY-73 TaxID=1231336 RepID=U4TNK1_9LACO|nr:hypothetical protein [Schleiferilactobacillus shenzhenensis]ERL65794.1 hypothetical protein L248_1870 [Schleiferilactobacillus shenzhenensis LY-73]
MADTSETNPSEEQVDLDAMWQAYNQDIPDPAKLIAGAVSYQSICGTILSTMEKILTELNAQPTVMNKQEYLQRPDVAARISLVLQLHEQEGGVNGAIESLLNSMSLRYTYEEEIERFDRAQDLDYPVAIQLVVAATVNISRVLDRNYPAFLDVLDYYLNPEEE